MMAVTRNLVLMILCGAWTCSQQVHLRRVQEASPPNGTSLSSSEYEGLLGLVGNGTTQLTSLYRTSVHGTSYLDLLDKVGDAKPLVLVIRKDKYVFGGFINCGIQLPDDPTDWHRYDCDTWYFSLAGHFTQPTKIDITGRGQINEVNNQWVLVAGRNADVGASAKVFVGGDLHLGWGDNERPAADIRSCSQWLHGNDLPEGYTGETMYQGGAVFGGSEKFMADEIEVLQVGSDMASADTEEASVQGSLPDEASLPASEHEGLLGLLGNDTTDLISLYRTSEHGTTYDDLLDSVGDAKPLVLVIKKDEYIFSVYISAGLRLPDEPTGDHEYDCDVWWFSLAGHFPTPTKIDIGRGQWVHVAGRQGNAGGANVHIGGMLDLGWGGSVSGRPAADIRSCSQSTDSDDLPAGYTGEWEYGDAALGGSYEFMADEIEVLHLVGL